MSALDLRYGVKIYDNDWFLRHRLSTECAADLLSEWGVTYVIAQSKFLPMPNSAVTSAVPENEREAYEALDDAAFRRLLGERGIAYLACLNICFDPVFSTAYPDALGIDQYGRKGFQEDWYVGIPPVRQENLDHKIELIERGVAALQPDAVHLGFIRWPGFWETWLDGDDRSAKPEYCFSRQTIERFNQETGLAIEPGNAAGAAREILLRHRDRWSAWKCDKVVQAIAQIRTALEPIKPSLQYSINTLPFFRSDFSNAVEEVFGQDVSKLAEVVDVFEVMAYHQILAKPETWPAAVASDIIARSGRKAVCTLQARALYLEGMHSGRGRKTEITEVEFAAALAALELSPVEGACVFTFTDLLDMRDTVRGRAMLSALKAFRKA